MPRTRRRAPGAWLALGTLVVAGLVVRLAEHRGSSLWFDEVITLEEASRSSLGETVRAKALHPPLIRVAARLSIGALGEPARPEAIDLALRMPSILMGTAAIVAIFFFARTFSDGDELVGLVAAAAWALLPYGIGLSGEARFYAALVLFAAWTLHALALFHRRQHLIDHARLALPLMLGCHTHYVFGFVFVLSALTVLPTMLPTRLPTMHSTIADGPRRRWMMALPWVVAGLAFLPWLGFAAPRLDAEDRGWVEPLAHQLRNVPVSFFTGRLGYYHIQSRDAVLAGATFLFAAGMAAHLTERRSRAARLTLAMLVPSLVATASLHHYFSETPLFHPKYLAFLYPFFCLFAGELTAYLVRRLPRRVVARDARAPIALVVVLAFLAPVARAVGDVYVRTLVLPPRVQRQPYAQAAAWIAARRAPGELLVVLECSRRYNQLALRHYGLRSPIARLRCLDPGDSLPASDAPRTFAALTHWGDDRARAAALEVLRARYGRIAERVVLPGVEGDVVVLALSRTVSRSAARPDASIIARDVPLAVPAPRAGRAPRLGL